MNWFRKWRFNRLVGKARKVKMTGEQEKLHRLSFAYGNLKIDRPETTRELVEEAENLRS